MLNIVLSLFYYSVIIVTLLMVTSYFRENKIMNETKFTITFFYLLDNIVQSTERNKAIFQFSKTIQKNIQRCNNNSSSLMLTRFSLTYYGSENTGLKFNGKTYLFINVLR